MGVGEGGPYVSTALSPVTAATVNRRTRLVAALASAALLAMAAAAPAQAAKRRVPFGFFGVNGLVGGVSDATLESQTALMARSGVESVRLDLCWCTLNPRPNVFDFSSTDR